MTPRPDPMPFDRGTDSAPWKVFALALAVGAFGLTQGLPESWAAPALGLLAAVLVAARVVAARPSHDEADRARLAASAALAATAGSIVAGSWSLCVEGAVSHFAPLAAVLGTSALLAGVAWAHDRARRAWLARLFAGRGEGWSVAPGGSAAGAPAPFVAAAPGDAVIAPAAAPAGPFREERGAPRARVPSQLAAVAGPLRRRVALLAGVVALDASLALALTLHRARPLVPLRDVAQLVAGPDQTCARRTDGSVVCWGANRRRAGRDGAVRSYLDTIPVVVPALAGAVDLAFADDTVCARDRGGRVRCAERGASLRPPPLRPGPRPGTVASSGDHECAVGDDGAVRCRGSNDDGELGDGPTPRRPTPSAVALPSPAAAVAVAYGFSCARLADGAAWCWGRMAQQRAVGAPLRPTLAPGLRDVATILVDGGSLWALRRDGTVWSWDGGPESRPLAGLTSVASLVGHHDAWCALTEVGAVECWPFGRPAARREVLRGAAELAADGGHVCARLRDGTVRCWGRNDHGELGDGTRQGRALPTLVQW